MATYWHCQALILNKNNVTKHGFPDKKESTEAETAVSGHRADPGRGTDSVQCRLAQELRSSPPGDHRNDCDGGARQAGTRAHDGTQARHKSERLRKAAGAAARLRTSPVLETFDVRRFETDCLHHLLHRHNRPCHRRLMPQKAEVRHDFISTAARSAPSAYPALRA
jgi:hypothetical protein